MKSLSHVLPLHQGSKKSESLANLAEIWRRIRFFDVLIFQNYEKVSFGTHTFFKNVHVTKKWRWHHKKSKLEFFFEKSIRPLKKCRIFRWSFWVLNGLKRRKSIFFVRSPCCVILQHMMQRDANLSRPKQFFFERVENWIVDRK